MVTYIPERETFTGSDATGTSPNANRTITLTQDSIVAITSISVAGTSLHEGASYDYTRSENVITFLNALWDNQPIDISYIYSTTADSDSVSELKYTTPLKFNEALEMVTQVPNYPVDNSKENIGTGDNSTTVFYLDNAGLIENTETLYTGSLAESAATTTLTRTTHYTMDNDKSKITLTVAGVTAVGTDSIFGEYKINKYLKRNSEIVRKLATAESKVDTAVDTVFADGTEATPDYVTVSNELHVGKGNFNTVYQTDKYPLNSSTTTLNGAIGTSTTTVTVASTQGFPSSGSFGTSSQKVTYTGKTSTTFTGCTGITSSIADGVTVTSYVIERSLDGAGTSPTFSAMTMDTDYSIDTDSGEVKLVGTGLTTGTRLDNFHPPSTVWDRVRLSYQYGYDTIPEEIVDVVHLIAGRGMFDAQVLNALGRGTNGFDSMGIEDVNTQIKVILNKYKTWMIKNINEQ